MPRKIEKAFEKEYGKKKGRLIFYKWENKTCSKCRKKGKYVDVYGVKICTNCGHQMNRDKD